MSQVRPHPIDRQAILAKQASSAQKRNGPAYSTEFAAPAQSTETKTQAVDAYISGGQNARYPASSSREISNVVGMDIQYVEEDNGLANLRPQEVMMPMQDQQAIKPDQFDLEMKTEKTLIEAAEAQLTGPEAKL